MWANAFSPHPCLRVIDYEANYLENFAYLTVATLHFYACKSDYIGLGLLQKISQDVTRQHPP